MADVNPNQERLPNLYPDHVCPEHGLVMTKRSTMVSLAKGRLSAGLLGMQPQRHTYWRCELCWDNPPANPKKNRRSKLSKITIQHGLPGTFGSMDALENEPPVSWLIRGWLAAREISVIYGQGGTYKSYICIGWSLQLAAFAGVPCLYVAAEGASGLRSRVDAWIAARNLDSEDLKLWSYYNAGLHVDDPTNVRVWVEGLKAYTKDRKKKAHRKLPQLVVVDTMARNFAGDENSAKDVGAFIEGLEYLRRELDTAVLVAHHMGVSTGRERGTGALRNATFAMFKTTKPNHNDRGGGSIQLECDRMKDAPQPDPVRLQFDAVDLAADEHGDVYQRSQAMRRFPPKVKKEKPLQEVIVPA